MKTGLKLVPALKNNAEVGTKNRDDEAIQLLNTLEGWMRQQRISSILSRGQATDLLEAFRSDRRFWAQQRRQFTRVWTSIVEGLKQESRPLSAVLGDSTSSRLLDALEEMDDDPALVEAVLRSEVVEKMLGHAAPPSGKCWSVRVASWHLCGQWDAQALVLFLGLGRGAQAFFIWGRGRYCTRVSWNLCSGLTSSATLSTACQFWARSASRQTRLLALTNQHSSRHLPPCDCS